MKDKFKKINKFKLNCYLIKEILKEIGQSTKWEQLKNNNNKKKEEKNSINFLKISQVSIRKEIDLEYKVRIWLVCN